MSNQLLVPLEGAVVFPGVNITLAADVGDDERVVLVPKHEAAHASVGTSQPRSWSASASWAASRPCLWPVSTGPSSARRRTRTAYFASRSTSGRTRRCRGQRRELEVEYRAVVEEILELRGTDERVSAFVRAVREPGALADTAGYSPDIAFDEKVQLLEAVDVVERLELALRLQRERLAELQVRKRIREDVESGAQKQQRDYFLRKQLDSIRKELGEDEGSVIEEYREQIVGRHARRRP